jgi:hypothetical protein
MKTKLKLKLLPPLFAFLVAVTAFAAACGAGTQTPPPAPDGPAQDDSGAAARGGFTVSQPEAGGARGWAFGAYLGDIGEIGYVEEEYFIEGTARRYAPVGKLKGDGKWSLREDGAAPYKTRFIVRRPADPARFNGTVVLEWANVSAGYEITLTDSEGLYKEGFAYVAASAQRNGLYGFAENPQGLIAWDGGRYGGLSIPDDGLSYDIYTQIARAVGKDRPRGGIDPMGGLEVGKLFAAGASQSGSRVLSYANGVQPTENAFDAVIPVVSAGRGTDFSRETAHVKEGGKTKVRNVSTRVREDINCKAFIINTQTEAAALGKLAQPDTPSIVSWQVAGAAHFAPYAMDAVIARNERDGITGALGDGGASRLRAADWTYVYEAALVRIGEWIDAGKQPPAIAPLDTINIFLGCRKDARGNAKGGVRLPEITAPIAKYDVNIMSGLSYSAYAFKQSDLLKLYPTHKAYVDSVTREANAAATLGIILPYRAERYAEDAQSDWVATLWTDAPAVPLTGSPFDFAPLIFAAVCAAPLLVIGLIAFLIVRKVRKRARKLKVEN